MLLSLSLWIQNTAFLSALRSSSFVYPTVLSLHMVAIAFFGGMIVMTNMRLLGWSLTNYSMSDVIGQLRVPKRWGFTLVFICGALMLGSKAEEYYFNVLLRTKLSLLVLVAVHALVFRDVYHSAGEPDKGRAKLAGATSLLLWIGVACAGRGIGYLDPPIGIHAGLVKLLTLFAG